ncbi:hypothetical protein TCAL_04487 [Tigriopus californicus]|uniref:LIM zinc-binding domain-containing protein n=1 Tax=Tigriopus californicus TaxID=6832 RepID=A0A553NY62_TIGCA|nr:hypothetical protein TCAL_04487 [Tigriopus californicus]
MLDSVLAKFSLSENPFIKHDKKLFGKTLFRTKFTRFGQAQKQQWQQPAPQFDNPIDEVSFTQRERVRRELAAILKGARSALDLNTDDLDKVTLTPKMLLEGQNMSAEDIKTWPSAPDLFHDSREHDDEWESSRLTETTSSSNCVKCRSPVYPLEKVEPMSGQLYHPQCFKCVECHTQLTLVTFCRSLHSNRDLQVYCRAHQPRQDKGYKVDLNSISIANAVRFTKENHLENLKQRIQMEASLPPYGEIVKHDLVGLRYF